MKAIGSYLEQSEATERRKFYRKSEVGRAKRRTLCCCPLPLPALLHAHRQGQGGFDRYRHRRTRPLGDHRHHGLQTDERRRQAAIKKGRLFKFRDYHFPNAQPGEAKERSFCFLCLNKPPEVMEEVWLQMKNIVIIKASPGRFPVPSRQAFSLSWMGPARSVSMMSCPSESGCLGRRSRIRMITFP
jgi:hypothetical protein